MTKYIWPTEDQTFTQLMYDHVTNLQVTNLPAKQKAPSKKRGRPLGSKNKVAILVEAKKRGRPLGSKNKEGHKAGHKDIYRRSPFFKVTIGQIDPTYGRAQVFARAQERMD